MYSVPIYTENDDIDAPSFRINVKPNSEAAKRCGVAFNPSNDIRVDMLKIYSAALMQAMTNALENTGGVDARSIATAKTYLESAQMFAVKALFVNKD